MLDFSVDKALNPNAHFWVGIEGGNIRHGNEMETMAWVTLHE